MYPFPYKMWVCTNQLSLIEFDIKTNDGSENNFTNISGIEKWNGVSVINTKVIVTMWFRVSLV